MKTRRRFVDLQLADLGLSEDGSPDRFLGRFDEAQLRSELEATGLLAALAESGYPDVVVRSACESGEHRLRILAPRGRVPIVDLRLAEGNASFDEPLLVEKGLGLLSFLAVHWLCLQDPRGRFTRERPRLPGQRYPGLGLGPRIYDLGLRWAAAWGKDGLVNVPEYFHNAVFYSQVFRFVSARRQGRFEALARDLAGLPVGQASLAVDAGRVLENGAPFQWEPGEMVAPLSDALRAYFASDAWNGAVAEAREAACFTLLPRRRRASPALVEAPA